MHHAHIDRFAQGHSAVHALDGRAKLLAVLAYTGVLVSYDRHAVAELIPLLVLPLAMLWLAQVPVWFALRRVAVLSPLILVLALSGPWYEPQPTCVRLGPWQGQMAVGWLLAGSMALKFALGVLALTALTATTPFSSLLESMRRLHVPALLVMLLGFVYRYLFVLIDQSMRLRRGRDFRGAGLAGPGRQLAATGGVVGSLLVRTLERSERIHLAMQSRGYDGSPHGLNRLEFRAKDAGFLAAVAAYLFVCRFVYTMLLAS